MMPAPHSKPSIKPPPPISILLATSSGNAGSLIASNWFGTAESGETSHAGFAAQKSVWWHWLAPATGQFSIHTHGSLVDTVLQVVTGNVVAATTNVAANDNDGAAGGASGVVFAVTAGTDYKIVVDAKGAVGQLSLAWNFAGVVQADLSLTMSGGITNPSSPFQYAATVTNTGPAAATTTQLTINLPSGVSFQSAARSDGGSLSCTLNGQVLSCSLGTLYANNAVNIYITANATTIGNYTASGNISAAVTDPSTANNSASAVEQVALSNTADAPLPQWAAVLLGMLLLGGVRYTSEVKRHA